VTTHKPSEASAPGRRASAAAALGLLLAGGALLTLSCCLRPWPTGRLPFVPHLPSAPASIKAPQVVSVLLVKSATPLTASCPGGGVWLTMQNGIETEAAAGEGPWQFGVQDGMLTLDAADMQVPVMALRPLGETFVLGDRAYRGRLLVEARPDGQVAASNTVGAEDYLRSVVGSEMFSRWDMNALMAQAVTARTYMLYMVAAKGRLTLMDMAYKGASAESREADIAVDLTGGILMIYNGRLFPAYFSSTCGGHTTSAARVFGEPADGPMQGVACDWCRESPAYEWRAVIPADRIAAALADRGVTQVDSIEPQGAGADGYATTVLVNGQVAVRANEFRLAVGPGELKSTRFTVERVGEDFVFAGRGYGHGVGLCQWGACGMARAGKDWQEILHYYYSGVRLVQVR
jgi:SpoIID/LytB domain protein